MNEQDAAAQRAEALIRLQEERARADKLAAEQAKRLADAAAEKAKREQQ